MIDVRQPVPMLPGPTQRVDRRLTPVDRSIRCHQRLQQSGLHALDERLEAMQVRRPVEHPHQPYDPPATGIRGIAFGSIGWHGGRAATRSTVLPRAGT